MIKHYVLDTNVLLHDPDALFEFEDNRVIVPIYVIEEIDKFKKDGGALGRAARQASRNLDALSGQGELSAGVPTENGGSVRVAFTDRTLPDELSSAGSTVDSRIIAVGLELSETHPDVPCVLVSKDVNLRIRAQVLGMRAEDFETDRTDIRELYLGLRDLAVDGATVDALYGDGRLPMRFDPEDGEDELAPHEFVRLVDEAAAGHTGLGQVNAERSEIVALARRDPNVWGIRPRNLEQRLAFELLLDDGCHLVTLVGKAGTGKTLLALAAALLKTREEKRYEKVLVARPIVPLGRDLGYLPGTVEEKMEPWMRPIFDNLEQLMGLSEEDKRRGRSHEEMLDMGMLEVEPLTYIRGRSLPRTFLIVDEAQNLTPHEMKTIVSRAGEGTKIVFTGDPYQVDNPYLDAASNGLIHVVNRFRGSALAGHIVLTKGERSPLAEEAATRL
ncbi:MAG: PhoH family protein [Myxococcota bacterium]